MKSFRSAAFRTFLLGIALGAGISSGESQASLITQEVGDNYIAFEAETFTGDPGGFVLVDGINQFQTDPSPNLPGGSPVLPAGNDASNGAVIFAAPGVAWNGPAGNSGQTTYRLRFTAPGTYRAYVRYTLFERGSDAGGTPSYGNEDSLFLPADFGLNGTIIEGLGSLGQVPGDGFWEGNNFRWDNTGESYVVSAAQVGQVLLFNIDNREGGTALDRFVLSTTTNLNNAQLDALVNSPVPEPSSWLLLLAALGTTLLVTRERRSLETA